MSAKRRHCLVIGGREKQYKGFSLDELKRDLAVLANLFSTIDFPLFLTGGVSISLQLNQFYRHHEDFDLGIFVEDLPKLKKYLPKIGYDLMRRYFMTHLTPWHDLHLLTSFLPEDLKRFPPGSSRIRIVKKQAIISNRKRTEAFDLFLWQKSDEGVIPVKNENIIPWDDFYPAKKIFPGSNLLVPNIKHKKHLTPTSKRQMMDIQRAGLDSDR